MTAYLSQSQNSRQYNQLKVLIQIVPLVILLGPLRSRQNHGLLGNVKELGSSVAADVTLLVLLGGCLVVVDLVGVDFATDEVLPELVAILDGVDHELDALVLFSDDRDHLITAGDFVVLRIHC